MEIKKEKTLIPKLKIWELNYLKLFSVDMLNSLKRTET